MKAKVLIVGATGGIGNAVALQLARTGYDCALMGRDAEAINQVADQCINEGVNAVPIVFDLTQISGIEAAVTQAIDQLGGLNCLVNCAGISSAGKLHEVDPAVGDAIIDTNLRAHHYLARYALPEINKNPGGAVIKIGAVHHPYSGVNTYLAANLGGDGYAEALFEDVREFGTRVCTIKPGWVNTKLVTTESNIDPTLMIQPEDIAQTVQFLLSMPATTCATEITLLPQRSPYR